MEHEEQRTKMENSEDKDVQFMASYPFSRDGVYGATVVIRSTNKKNLGININTIVKDV